MYKFTFNGWDKPVEQTSRYQDTLHDVRVTVVADTEAAALVLAQALAARDIWELASVKHVF
jgi:phenylacetate-coenzyme A ligase PaaK-like adenylate-forming protein